MSAEPYRLVSLAVFAFGFAAFSSLFVLWLRQKLAFPHDLKDVSYPVVFLSTAAWFAANILSRDFRLLLAFACVFPPLLSHLFHRRLSRLVLAGAALLAIAALSGAPARWLVGSYCLLFAAAALGSFLRPAIGRPNRLLLALSALAVPFALYSNIDWLSLVIRSLPLLLLLVHSYSFRRFLFLDLFVKWGAYFLLSLLVATLFFLWIPASSPALLKALASLPLLWGLPRVCRALGVALDRHWFGRAVSPAEAQREFLHAIHLEPSEPAALQRARTLLHDIFHSEAAIHVGAAPECAIELAPRPDGRPYFSEDLELRDALAQSLGVVVANRRAELRALRAQINPHFLFNALNAVAALIPQNPERAEQTVEQLADVFRYQLKHSGTELVTVARELDFIRAYLEVERTRFAGRLDFIIDASPDTLEFRIPAMALHTLVENALKHGISQRPSNGVVRISADRRGSAVWLCVADNGPGPLDSRLEGHGLMNVRARLRGHLGDAASLTLSRDEVAGLTIAAIEVAE